MICSACRDKNHKDCPEAARQEDPNLGDLEKSGSDLCYCHCKES